MKQPVPNPRQTDAGRSNGSHQPNGSGPPRYIPTQHLDLAGIRRSVLIALLIACLIPVAAVLWGLSQLGGSSPKTTAGHPTASPAAARHAAVAVNYRQSPLFKTLVGVNESSYARGYLPPSSCKAMSASMVTCIQPHYAIDEVIFRTLPSLKALYTAYMARVSALAQGPFRANFGNCTENMENGEIGWNHEFHHPSYYPISMFTSGRIKDEQAAGRMYCTLTNGVLYLVWTQDAGRMLAELAGAPHYDAYTWWHNVHHEIAFPGLPNLMGSMSGMQGTTSTKTSSQSMSGMPGTTSTKTSPQSMSRMPGTTSTKRPSHSMPSTKGKQSGKSMSGMK
ncbi:MAG: hypothetical protein JOY89_15520 [Solirubrobacterales bacterium]|nr:hypothetical protein [Solirubrobacterales bacterium]